MTNCNKDGVVMILTGLSVRVCGCLISVDRVEEGKALIVVDFGGQISLLPQEFEAVKFQAGLLRDRASRFFGAGWEVKSWDGLVSPGVKISLSAPLKGAG
jgi:hypothetical protein